MYLKDRLYILWCLTLATIILVLLCILNLLDIFVAVILWIICLVIALAYKTITIENYEKEKLESLKEIARNTKNQL